MKKKFKNFYLTDKMILLSFLAGALLFAVVYLFCTGYERSEGRQMIEDTLDFMKLQCIRYDNLTASEQAENQIQLLDKTQELGRCLEEGQASELDTFLENYAKAQRLSGIILLDQDGTLLSHVSLDGETYEEWENILQDNNVTNVLEYSQKAYLSRRQTEDGRIYDYTAIGLASGTRFLFCYERQTQVETDELSIGLDNLLSGYHLEMNGQIMITDGTRILSSNDNTLTTQEVSSYPLIAGHTEEFSSGQMRTLKEEGIAYLAGFDKFRNYHLYVFYPARAVFRQRTIILSYVMIFYILLLLIITIVRQQDLQHTDQLKMSFLRQMSHDIRTPINGIRGMIQIGNSFPEDMAKQQECRDKIWDASTFLLDLVNDVLDMAKLESGEIMLDEKPFHLQELLQNELYLMEGQAREYGVSLQLGELNIEHQNLIGSLVHIQRILTNLISNAIKYNQAGGSVTLSCRELDKKTEPGTAVFEFICADTGIGMGRDFQKRMFEQFTQEHAAGEMSHHGTGLGLTIVQNLVQKMGGQIRCESERGKGTTFFVTLPFDIDPEPEHLAPESAMESGKHLSGVSILLVEDNELNMEIAEFLLTEEGAVVQKAENGQEAVRIFGDSAPGEFQIILMDIMMPVMDGETAARTIRALDRPDARTIPIIAMTANAFSDDIASSLQSGMNAHLAKPIEQERMIAVIREYIP
jgi:signal transduction histidine kinase